jgi:chemotaxis protein methyltransferase CheR
MAMIFLEKLKPRFPDLNIEILATDISGSVLHTAIKGLYSDYSIRNLPPLYLGKYFQPLDGRYQIRDDLRQLVKFQIVNLYDRQQMRTLKNFDIVFCRNVLIYFDTKSKVQVVSDLYNSINHGGYLFIGYSELLHGISTAFKVVNFPKSVAYKKE